jgi:hypothetical protein
LETVQCATSCEKHSERHTRFKGWDLIFRASKTSFGCVAAGDGGTERPPKVLQLPQSIHCNHHMRHAQRPIDNRHASEAESRRLIWSNGKWSTKALNAISVYSDKSTVTGASESCPFKNQTLLMQMAQAHHHRLPSPPLPNTLYRGRVQHHSHRSTERLWREVVSELCAHHTGVAWLDIRYDSILF